MFQHLSQLVVQCFGLSPRRRTVGWSLGLGIVLSLLPLFTSGVLPSQAVEVASVVNPRQAHGGWVTDQADLLSADAEAQLNALLSELEAVNGAEVAVVTVPEVAPSPSPKAFTTELFNTWGIGKEGQDNGLLVMVSKGDRHVEIETGYGLEASLPDARVGKIIRDQMIPSFKAEDYEKAIVDGTLAVAVSIHPGLTLPETMSIELSQQAETLVKTWEQEEIREQEQAAQQEADRIARKEAEARWLQAEQEREAAEQAALAERLPLYPQLLAVGVVFMAIGGGLFLKRFGGSLAQLSLEAVEQQGSSAVPQEAALNRDVQTAVAKINLGNALVTIWPYALLAMVGCAAFQAGGLGWIVTHYRRAQTLQNALLVILALGGLLALQTALWWGVTQWLATIQSQFCQRLSLDAWDVKAQVNQVVVWTLAQRVKAICVLVICAAMPIGLTILLMPKADVFFAKLLVLISLTVSAQFAWIIHQLERRFRLEHLGKQAVCQSCFRGIAKKVLLSSDAVRAVTPHPEALSEVEAIAIDIGNISYFAHACGQCVPGYPPGKTYLERQVRGDHIECPNCHEDTLERKTTKTTLADYYEHCRSETCHHCDYGDVKTWKEEKPKPRPVSSSLSSSSYSSSRSSWSSGASSNSSSGSSRGSSSGGGSFGGGSSGGGGAGGSW